MFRVPTFRFVHVVIVSSTAAIASAQPPTSTVQPASYGKDPTPARQRVQFTKQGSHVGDQIEQRILLELRMATSLRQGNEVVEKSEMSMQNLQRRVVTTSEVRDGGTQAVLVRYPEATKHLITAEDVAASKATPQPVQGKAYRVRRDAGPEGQLVVADEAGLIPPLEEFVIVAQSMEMVGRPNPLADFLSGRTVAIGETLALPKQVADRLFGIGERFGEVSRFDLTLDEVRAEEGRRCAVFRASVDAAATNSSQMRMQIEGPIAVEIDSCRVVRTKLAGPIAMTESRGTYSAAYQFISTGQIAIAIDAAYRDAAR